MSNGFWEVDEFELSRLFTTYSCKNPTFEIPFLLRKQPTPTNSLNRRDHHLQTLFSVAHCDRLPLFFIVLPFLKSFSSPISSDPNLHLQSDSLPKFKQGTKRYFTGKRRRKKEYESKGKEMEFTVQTSGEFQCPPRHSRALFNPRRLWGEKSSSHSRVHLFWQVLTHSEKAEQGLFV